MSLFKRLRQSLIIGLILSTAPAQAIEDEALYSPDQLRADFTQLYATMQTAHADIYAATPRQALDQHYEEMLRLIDEPMGGDEAAILFQTFLAHIRHGHARIDFPLETWSHYRENGGGAFAVDLRIRDGRVWIENHQTGLTSLDRGDEILAVNAEPNAIWLARLTRYLSAETPDLAYTLLETYLPLLVWLEYPQLNAIELHVRKASGAEAHIAVPLLSREAMAALPEAASSAFVLPEFDARMLDSEIGYLRPGPFYNTEPDGNPWDPTGYIARVDTAFTDFIAQGAKAVIIDIRDNPGGNSSFSDPIIAWFADEPWSFASEFRMRVSDATTASNAARLAEGGGGVSQTFAELFAEAENGEVVLFELPIPTPREGERFEGEVYVLINRYSYSNAVNMAATVQDYNFATVVGEATSDMSTTYGAMEHFSLDETGIRVGYPKAHIIRPNGDTHSHPVSPDFELAFPVLRGPEDEVLAQLQTLIAERLGD